MVSFLNREARKDPAAWKLFLDNFNGASRCLPNTWTSLNCVQLFSDVSGSGFAVILGFGGCVDPSQGLGPRAILRSKNLYL